MTSDVFTQIQKSNPAAVSNLERQAEILRALGHPSRLRIIVLLTENGRLSVNDIADRIGMEQSLLSHHLASMKAHHILCCQREGKKMFYTLCPKLVIDQEPGGHLALNLNL